jgi:hypothetical protein
VFLNLLAPAQQRLFVQAARLIAASDGVAEEEQALLDAVEAECGLEERPDDADLPAVLDAMTAALDTQTARRTFLLELAGVAVIDGHAYEAELELLEQFAQRLQIGDEDLQECLALAARARQLVADGEAFIATSAVA